MCLAVKLQVFDLGTYYKLALYIYIVFAAVILCILYELLSLAVYVIEFLLFIVLAIFI